MIFFNEKNRKILIILDIENSLWKSEIDIFCQLILEFFGSDNDMIYWRNAYFQYIYAYIVSCAQWSKNLERYLISRALVQSVSKLGKSPSSIQFDQKSFEDVDAAVKLFYL